MPSGASRRQRREASATTEDVSALVGIPAMLTQQVEHVAPSALTPHPDNPNRGNVASIVASMRRNGFYGALVVQRSTGHVIAGNHRLAAALELGYATVPTIYADVTDAQALEILVADNRTAELAHRDPAALLAILDTIHGRDTDALAGIGFQVSDLDSLRASPATENISAVEFPEYDETAAEQVVMHTCPNCQHAWPA